MLTVNIWTYCDRRKAQEPVPILGAPILGATWTSTVFWKRWGIPRILFWGGVPHSPDCHSPCWQPWVLSLRLGGPMVQTCSGHLWGSAACEPWVWLPVVTVILPHCTSSRDLSSGSTAQGGTWVPLFTPGSGTWELPHHSLGIGGQNPISPHAWPHLPASLCRRRWDPDFLIYESSIVSVNQRRPQKGGMLSLILSFALLKPSMNTYCSICVQLFVTP